MPTNLKDSSKLIFPELSYQLTGIFFQVHNDLGRYCREKQYSDYLDSKLRENKLRYIRELLIKKTGNIIDFLIEDKIILEIKAKPFITKEDYYQVQRYLHNLQIKLGMIVNFRSLYLKPKRVILIKKKS